MTPMPFARLMPLVCLIQRSCLVMLWTCALLACQAETRDPSQDVAQDLLLEDTSDGSQDDATLDADTPQLPDLADQSSSDATPPDTVADTVDTLTCSDCQDTQDTAEDVTTADTVPADVCSDDTCGPTCPADAADCDGDPSNGCEQQLTTRAHCGGCNVPCSGPPNVEVSCASGTCESLGCVDGWLECDGNTTNGCETAGLSYIDEVLADGPVGYWRLGEASGLVAVDSGPNKLDAVYQGVQLGVAGALSCSPDTAVGFSQAASSRVMLDRNAALEPAAALSVELWVQQSDVVGQFDYLVAYGYGATLPGGAFRIERIRNRATEFTFMANVDGQETWLDVNGVPQDTQWHHLVATFDGSTGVRRFFVDGGLVANATAPSGDLVYDTVHGLSIGADAVGSSHFSGAIDEVAIYDFALSPTRVAAHYAAGRR